MPLGRNARQQRQRTTKASSGAWTPRIDVFGTLRLPSEEVRARLIEYAPATFAAFSAESIENPILFTIEGEFNIKGRIMTAQSEAGEVKFQKAGCGCETPHQLRTARSKLLEHVPTAPQEPTLTPDELTQQVLEVSGL